MCRSRLCDLYCVSTTTLQVAGVDDVGQREVDQPVDAAERHRRLGPVGRQRHQPLALAAGEDDRQHLRVAGCVGHGRHPRRVAPGRARAARRSQRLASTGRARRHPDQGVPAGRLRRRGRPRRRAGPGAARARRRRRRGCAASARRATRPGTTAYADLPELARRQRRAADPRRRPAHRRRTAPAPTSCTRTPGTPTWPATWPRCCTASRTSSPRTASSRCGRGRPSSSAAATRVSSWAERTAYEAAAARHRGQRRHARRHPRRPTPTLDPARVHVVHNGIDTELWPRRRRTRTSCAAHGVDPDRPSVVFVGRITRQKGLPLLPARGRASCRRTSSSCSAPARPTPRRSWPRSRGWSTDLRADARRRRLDPRDAAARRRRRAARRGDGVRLPVGLRAARHRQPRGDGLRDGRRRHRDRRHPRGRRRRRDRLAGADRAGRRRHRHAARPRRGSSPTSPRRSPRPCRDPDRAARVRAGRPRPAPSSTSPGRSIGDQTLEVYRPVLGADAPPAVTRPRSGVLAAGPHPGEARARRRWRRSRRPGRRWPAAR